MEAAVQSTDQLPSVERYERHLKETTAWLLRTVASGHQGSSAYYLPVRGFSNPYPETTGYLIPTLLTLAPRYPEMKLEEVAVGLGRWLLSIQHEDGYWFGGTHPPKSGTKGSVFNTGQILIGMAALARHSGDSEWLDSGRRGAEWLVNGLDDSGLWPETDYRSAATPSYYSRVAWPILEMADVAQSESLRDGGAAVLNALLKRLDPETGRFSGWSFEPERPAFTHTIAYTIRGFLEGARFLDWDVYGKPIGASIDWLTRRAELSHGRLPGSFDENGKAAGDFVCLTGNAQSALCLLFWEARHPDLRLVSASAKLIDFVCSVQNRQRFWPGARGAVAGSTPLWGPYMRFRYPNWSAKFHCDALVQLIARLEAENEAEA